jgi:NADH-quinone oxidoreductase subunit G
VLDHLRSATALRAGIALPAAAFAEASGTLVNSEGRAQRSFQVFVPAPPIDAAWRWLGELAAASGKRPANPWPDLDTLTAAIAAECPDLAAIAAVAPPASFRWMGQRIARQPPRHTGRAAMTAHLDVHEPQPPRDADAPLGYTMEGSLRQPPSSLIPRFWAPQWNSIQAVNKFQAEIGGPLRGGDPGRRLIEACADASPPYFDGVPEAFTPRDGEWLFLPAWHIHGSEESSACAEAVARRIPAAYVGINPDDARRLGLAEGQGIAMTVEGRLHQAPARLMPIPAGTAMLPAGLPGLPPLRLPAWGRLSGVQGAIDR